MTAGFDDRKKAAEAKWAHDEELRFKVMARRNKLLGLWAAGEKGLSGDAASAYAKEVVAADFDEPGDEDVFRKVRVDLDPQKVTDAVIRAKMDELLTVAADQIEKEVKK
jgi:hypothetical protein